VGRGEIRSLVDVQEILENPRATAWETVYFPLLSLIPLGDLVDATGIAESLLFRYKKNLVRPSPRNMKRLIGALRHYPPELARVRGRKPPARRRDNPKR
jgi:hypothetical protein